MDMFECLYFGIPVLLTFGEPMPAFGLEEERYGKEQ